MCAECAVIGHQHVGANYSRSSICSTLSRDIVGECDKIFSVKSELIYTMGMSSPIEFSPHRWTIIQTTIGRVIRFTFQAKKRFPLLIEVHDRWPVRVPRIRILRPEADELVLNNLASYICETGFPGFPISRQERRVRRAVFKYIRKLDLSRNVLVLFRGLIALGILSLAFGSKRWRVNYGLDQGNYLHLRGSKTDSISKGLIRR